MSGVADHLADKHGKDPSARCLKLRHAANGSVVTRFPPEPSAPIDLGHVKAALINKVVAARHQGTCILRYDDTNPANVMQAHVDQYVEDLQLLGLTFDQTTFASDYFQQLYGIAADLIRAGKMYADCTPKEQMRAERLAGQFSAYRSSSPEESLAAWHSMCTPPGTTAAAPAAAAAAAATPPAVAGSSTPCSQAAAAEAGRDDALPAKEQHHKQTMQAGTQAVLGSQMAQAQQCSDSAAHVCKGRSQLPKAGGLEPSGSGTSAGRDQQGSRAGDQSRTSSEQVSITSGGASSSPSGGTASAAAASTQTTSFSPSRSPSSSGSSWVLRYRMDPGSANGALRDPVCFRCCSTPHFRTGTSFPAYPTYDFACPCLDALQGVTHALRTSQFRDRDPQYSQIQEDVMRLRPGLLACPTELAEFPRINMAHVPQTKAQMKALLAAGAVAGWDDPRLPTVRGLLRQGLLPQALCSFLLEQITPARKVTFHSWDKLWATNASAIDLLAARHMAVELDGAVPLLLADVDAAAAPEVHRQETSKGRPMEVVRYRMVLLDRQDVQHAGPGQELLLIGWGHCRLHECCAVEHGGASNSNSTSTDAGAVSGSSSRNEARAQHLTTHGSAAEAAEQPGTAAWQELLGSHQPSGGCYLVGHLLPAGPRGRPVSGSRPTAVHWVPALLPGASALGRAAAAAPAPDPAAQGPSMSSVQEQLQRLQGSVLAAAQHQEAAAGCAQAPAADPEDVAGITYPSISDTCDSSTVSSTAAKVGRASQASSAAAASDTPQQSQASCSALQCVLLQLVSYRQPLSVRVVADKDDVLCQVASCSVQVTWAVGSPSLAVLQQGELLQLQRCGFHRVDWLSEAGCDGSPGGAPRVLRLIQVPQK